MLRIGATRGEREIENWKRDRCRHTAHLTHELSTEDLITGQEEVFFLVAASGDGVRVIAEPATAAVCGREKELCTRVRCSESDTHTHTHTHAHTHTHCKCMLLLMPGFMLILSRVTAAAAVQLLSLVPEGLFSPTLIIA